MIDDGRDNRSDDIAVGQTVEYVAFGGLHS